jgi:hypothetical protein
MSLNILHINLTIPKMSTRERPYGVDMQINAPGLKSILKWGTKSLDAKET